MFSALRFGRTLSADHFGENNIWIWSTNNGAVVKIMEIPNCCDWWSEDCLRVFLLYNCHLLVIFNKFCNKLISQEGSTKPEIRKYFMWIIRPEIAASARFLAKKLCDKYVRHRIFWDSATLVYNFHTWQQHF